MLNLAALILDPSNACPLIDALPSAFVTRAKKTNGAANTLTA